MSWETRRNIRPWNKSLYVRCLRFLSEGDQIEIIFGDTSKGSPGWLMQTFCESALPFRSLLIHLQRKILLHLKTMIIQQLVLCPPSLIVGWLLLPTLRRPDEPFRLSIKCNDKWGNPSDLIDQTSHIKSFVTHQKFT